MSVRTTASWLACLCRVPHRAPFRLAVCLVLLGTSIARADNAQYFYDPAGRLTAMVDPVQGSAQYTYDAVGNILSVIRRAPTDLLVAQVTPSGGPAGTTVTIAGTGFGTTANTSVSFNGTPATPTAVSATQITVAVPSGATTGPVSVTAPAGTAATLASFTVPATPGPAISGFSPAQVNQGSTITVSGNGFDPVPANNKVLISGRFALVTAATPTSLTVFVPIIGSGRITVSTVGGTATSATPLIVPPPPFLVSNLGTVIQTTLGNTVIATVSTAGQFVPILFDATAGQRVSVPLSNSTFSSVSATIYGPDGAQVGPTTTLYSQTGFIDVQPLGIGGTYTLLVSGNGSATGSITANPVLVPPDASSTISANGTPVSLTSTAPGQNFQLSFAGTAGQRVSLLTQPGSGLSNQCWTVTVLNPDGTTQLYTTNNCGASTFTDVLVLPTTGTYSILFNPSGTTTGTATFTLYTVPPDASSTISANGTPVSLTSTAPGQNFQLSFAGTAGQRVSLLTQPGSGLSNQCWTVTVLNPDGTTQLYTTNNCGASTFTDVLVLPTTGTYSILFNPSGTATGTATFTLYTVPPDASSTISANGTPVSLTSTAPGQNFQLSFAGTAGQRVSLLTQPGSGLSNQCWTVTVLNPDGTTQLYTTNNCGASTFTDVLMLPTTGTYSILFNPSGTATGTATFTLYTVPPDASSTISANGTPVSLTSMAPGQNFQLSFAGTAGQRVSLLTQPGSGLSNQCWTVTVLNPDGTTQLYTTNNCGASTFTDVLVLPTTGTYSILFNPSGTATGTATFTLYTVAPDAAATITPGGGTIGLTSTAPGQNFQLSFAGTAGQRVSLLTQESGSLTQQCWTVTILQPNGTTQLYNTSNCGASNYTGVLPAPPAISSTVPTLPVSGAYTILFNPWGTVTGTATFTLYAVPPDATAALTVGAAAVNMTTTAPGQALRATFSGAANQSVSVKVSQVSVSPSGGCSQVTVLQPNGTTVVLGTGTCGSGFSSGSLNLPVTGTYTLVVGAWDMATGTYAVGVSSP